MKALVRVSSDPMSWLSSSDDVKSADIRLWMLTLKDSSILVSDSTRRELLSSLQSKKNSEILTAILTDFIRNQPKTNCSKVIIPDFLVGSKDPFRSIDSAVSADIKQLADLRSQEIEEGLSTSEAYEQTIGIIAKLSKSVTILDPYAGGSISSANPKRSWLIRRLLEDGVRGVHIVTTIPDNKETQGLSISERLGKLKRAHDRLSSEARGAGTTLSIEIFEPDRFFHHRRIEFTLDEGSLYFGLEKGLDGFAPGKAIPGEVLSEISATAYKSYLKAIRDQLVRAS